LKIILFCDKMRTHFQTSLTINSDNTRECWKRPHWGQPRRSTYSYRRRCWHSCIAIYIYIAIAMSTPWSTSTMGSWLYMYMYSYSYSYRRQRWKRRGRPTRKYYFWPISEKTWKIVIEISVFKIAYQEPVGK
jgi:hypothetical protein